MRKKSSPSFLAFVHSIMYRAPTNTWYVERFIRLIAGLLTLGGLALGFRVNERLYLIPAFVGLNLVIFALSGRCLLAVLLSNCGIKTKIQ